MTFPNNPIDTHEQRQHEQLAVKLFNGAELHAKKADVRQYWLDEVKPSADMLSCFDAAFEEVMFGAVIWALNQDPLYPKAITISRVPHKLGDLEIPGSRWGIDNPDSVYRVIPISGEERYEISGRVNTLQRLVENYFTLWDPNMQTMGLLSGKDLVVDSEGRFTISVDAEPAGGRVNHIQSCPTAHEFYIRDVVFDWANDRVNELAVKRLGKEPARPPMSEAELTDLAAQYMQKWATNTTRWNNQALLKPANEFSFTIDRDSDGALRNQIYIMGHFKLASDDEVMLLEVDMGGAEYFIAPITNVWGTTNHIIDRNGCLNKHQAVANPNGSYTFVVSVKDPGVSNWLDPSDMREGILTLRWAEFENDLPQDTLGVKCKVVPMAELNQHLPVNTPTLTTAQRAEASQARVKSYAWRIAEEHS